MRRRVILAYEDSKFERRRTGNNLCSACKSSCSVVWKRWQQSSTENTFVSMIFCAIQNETAALTLGSASSSEFELKISMAMWGTEAWMLYSVESCQKKAARMDRSLMLCVQIKRWKERGKGRKKEKAQIADNFFFFPVSFYGWIGRYDKSRTKRFLIAKPTCKTDSSRWGKAPSMG